jgi:anti-anti-sigma factor
MQLTHEQRGKYLLIKAVGRLDATWAEHFADSLLLLIRQGHHQLFIDASGMSFLSSAGIRSLMQVHKELLAVQGAFMIIHATEFVSKTLETTGLHFWLATELPADMPSAEESRTSGSNDLPDVYHIKPSATLSLAIPARWRPWQMVPAERVASLAFTNDVFALGIGCAAHHADDARSRYGDFLAVAGNVIYQPPDESSRPDYLLAEHNFIPEMQVIQAVSCSGEMSHLLRFAPGADKPFHPLSDLVKMAMEQTGRTTIGFVIVGEVEGLVGATMIQSPGLLDKDRTIDHPELTDWLSFCGERAHAGKQVLIFGVASQSKNGPSYTMLPLMPSQPDLSMHAHACVFPFQPLQNGHIDMDETLKKFVGGPPPEAIMHLADDARPAVGLGQSALVRGACWCSPIVNPEEIS